MINQCVTGENPNKKKLEKPHLEISIRRQAKRSSYTVIDNRLLNDSRLSPAALGILVNLLHRPNDWEVSLEQLKSQWRIGRDQLQRIMSELRDCGYARLECRKNSVTGHLFGKVWIIIEEGDHADRAPEKQLVGVQAESLKNRQSENPTDGKQAPIINTEIKPITESETTPNPKFVKVDEHGHSFQQFETAYPFQAIDRRQPALEAFSKLSAVDALQAIEMAPKYAAECTRLGRKLCSPQRWISERGWEGFAKETKPNAPKAAINRAKTTHKVWIEEGSHEERSWTSYTLLNFKTRPVWALMPQNGKRGFWRDTAFPPGLNGTTTSNSQRYGDRNG